MAEAAAVHQGKAAACLWKDDLVDDNVVSVNLKPSQFLHQTLCLIQGQKLWYADADECRQLWVLELGVDLLNNFLQFSILSSGHNDSAFSRIAALHSEHCVHMQHNTCAIICVEQSAAQQILHFMCALQRT